ncbi:MAG: urea transporter permease subunit UrtC, partial [Verrucomicrobiaceae bacterium]|nr:urea transporter permease subunit UrtC [Verrucomicrobiaceae bacterium]
MNAMFKSFFKSRGELVSFAVLAFILLVILPVFLPVFRLNLVGKYLSFGFVSVGLVLLWGRCGILSLGQG